MTDMRTSSANADRIVLYTSFGLLGAGAMVIVAYGIGQPRPVAVVSFGLLVALAALMVGVLLGFVFGIPRSGQNSDARGYQPNTNMEQISDWLTKIIIGVGLVELGTIITHYGRLNDKLARGFGDHPSAGVLAGAELVFFTAVGFLLGWVLTRTYLLDLLVRYDEKVAATVGAAIPAIREAMALHLASSAGSALQITGQLDPAAMAPQHNREPHLPVPRLAEQRPSDLVELVDQLTTLLAEMVFPLDPGGHELDELLEVLVGRGVLQEDIARPFLELAHAADNVAGGAALSPEAEASVRNSATALLRQWSKLASAAPRLFEHHVLETLAREAPEAWTIANDVALDADREVRVDAKVSASGGACFVEFRARVHARDDGHQQALRRWLRSLPADIHVLLVLPGNPWTEHQIARLLDGLPIRISILWWDHEAGQLIERVRMSI